MTSSDDNRGQIKSLFLFAVELHICGLLIPLKDITDMIKDIFKSGVKKKIDSSGDAEITTLFAYFYNSEAFSAFFSEFGEIFTNKVPSVRKTILRYPEIVPEKKKKDLT